MENELVLEEDLVSVPNQRLKEKMAFEDYNSQLERIYKSDMPYKEQKRKIYELQMPFLNMVHSNVVYGIIMEALAQGLLTDEPSLEAARASRTGYYYEEFELLELHRHKEFAYIFGQAYKYMNLARLLNLRWIVQLQEVIRTPESLILVRHFYETTLEELLIHECNSVTTARAILMLANAIICLQNYGIAHRDIRPSKVLVNTEPRLHVMIYGFHHSTSYLDEDKLPPNKATEYNPPQTDWSCGSKQWDVYSLCVIIYEWHLRRLQLITENGPRQPISKIIFKKEQFKSFPAVVKLALESIGKYQEEELATATAIRDAMEAFIA